MNEPATPRPRLSEVVVALYVLVLAILGPLLTAQSRRIARWLPAPSTP